MSSGCTAIRCARSNRKTFSRRCFAPRKVWDNALAHGEKFGYRNSQATVLAPTGTIGFMMDCDTTASSPISRL